MLRTLGRYINLLIITLIILSVLSFSLAYLFPGDALTNLSGVRNPTPQQLILLSEKYRINESVFSQYVQFMQLFFAGDWGVSFTSGLPLAEEIARTLPATIELAVYALIISLGVGVPLGFIAGTRYHSSVDYSVQAGAALSFSIPAFWLALIFILFFCMQLGWFPLSGRISLLFDVPSQTGFILIDILLSDSPDKELALRSAIDHLILPTLSIALITTANIARITRRAVLDVMSKDYIKAAKARGLSPTQVFFKHTIRNSLVPILPIVAVQITTLITNAMIIETIFSWPGIGDWLIQAIYQRDYSAIRAGMLAVSGFVVIIIILIELSPRLLDPTKDEIRRVSI